MSDKKEYHTEGEYVIIEEIWDCDWNWDITAAIYSPTRGCYFIYEDCGCSCDGPYEGFWDTPWEPGSRPMDKQELIKEINAKRNDSAYTSYRAEDFNELAQAVREFNPDNL